MTATPSNPVQSCQPSTEGYNEALGHAASLLQQAIWIEESVDGTVEPSQRVDLGDIDIDELRSAAQFIGAQAARIEELEAALRPFTGYQLTVVGFANVTSLKSDLDGCNWVAGFSGPTQPEFRHFGNARAVLQPKGAAV